MFWKQFVDLLHTLFVFFPGPYIVYLLRDVEIIEDWTEIKKVCTYFISHELS